MHTKKILLPLLSLAVVFFVSSAVSAKADDERDSDRPTATPVLNQEKEDSRVSATATREREREGTSTQERGNSTSTAAKEKRNENGKDSKGQGMAAEHRSAVANFVQSLKDVADREGGIGAQVRVIAKAQDESKDKVANEVEAVETRNPIKTFLIGTDYKSLGALRSDMVQTASHIDQLKRLAEKASSTESQAELANDIKALEQEQTKINDFISANESKFSLFGWVVKLFQ